MDSFSSLIAPLSLADFLEKHWEKTFLHQAGDPSAFSGLFSLAEVDRFLRGGKGRVFVTPKAGPAPVTDSMRPGEVSLSVFYAAFRKGDLLVLQPFEDWPGVQDLVAGIGRELYAEVGASAFVAPEGARAFPPHAAGNDTLVLQLEGAATWHLHEFWLLQRNPVEKKNLKFPLEWYGRPKTPVAAELRLEPGHLLYIPRGMPYQVQPRDRFSLHLQLDVQPLGWMDLLKIAIDVASVRSQELRRSVPPAFMQGAPAEDLGETYRGLLRDLAELAPWEQVVAATRRNRVKAQGFPADGHFSQLLELDRLAPETWLEHRPGILCFSEEVTDVDKEPRSALFFGEELVAGPKFLLPAAAFVRDHPRFRISEIPGLDPAGQITFARRLIVEGLLRRADEANGD